MANEAADGVVISDEENLQGARVETEKEPDLQAGAAFVDILTQAADGDSGAAVPALVQTLKGTNRIVRWDTMLNLGRIHADPGLVVPLLMENLDPTNINLATAILVLGEFGENAKPAIQAILQRLNDKDDFVRFQATNALKQIDPEAADKAGVR
jgi:hypothetical protein